MLWRNIVPALLSSANATVGSAQFYLATFFTDAIWLGSWLLWETAIAFLATHRASLFASPPLAQRSLSFSSSAGSSFALPPLLAKPASDLLDNMRHGSVPITLTTLFINGVGEELFFRDVARRPLADAFSPPAILTQLALYITATTAMGIPSCSLPPSSTAASQH